MSYETNIRNWWRDHIETLIYVALWMLIFTAPAMNLYIRMLNDPTVGLDWSEVGEAWNFTLPFLAVFVAHNWILSQLLIKRHRVKQYLCAMMVLLAIFTVVLTLAKPILYNGSTWLPATYADNTTLATLAQSGRNEMMPLLPGAPIDVVSTMVALLMMGMNLDVKLFFKSENNAQELHEAERQNLEAQLAYLRYQVNPHFYMNTLNNIHALVDINPERAKTSIVELSKMMRYILYDGEREGVSLKRELTFLDNYIRLMMLRYASSVRIDVKVPTAVPDRLIPPLMLIIFVENAFKHGISYKGDSFVEVRVEITDDRLHFVCRNSKHDTAQSAERGGMGLVNVCRRLDLLYGTRYSLETTDGDDCYEVRLEMPFLEDEKRAKHT